MSGPGWMAIGTGAMLDGGVKATVVLTAGLGVAYLLRHKSASTRHGVYTATLMTLPGLPLLAFQRGPDVAVDAPWLLAVWGAGLAATLAPLLVGLWKLERAWRDHTQHSPDGYRMSGSVSTPLTFGWRQPRILLPLDSVGWPEGRLRTVLAHERAHIRRRDWLVHVLVWFVCALFWFHPLAWQTRRLLRRDAEHAADDIALGQLLSAADYAETLVALARARAPRAALAQSPTELERRVRAVLEVRPRNGLGTLAFVALWGTLMSTAPALASLQTWNPPTAAPTCAPTPESTP